MTTFRTITGLLAWFALVAYGVLLVLELPESQYALAGFVGLLGVFVAVPQKRKQVFKGGDAPVGGGAA